MNREILFRGKRIDNDKWVYGYYCPMPFSHFPCKPCIFPSDTINSHWHGVEIIENTLGQYIGLTDKNGVKIFEGDIINAVRFCDFGENYECKGYDYGDIRTASVNHWLEFADEIEVIGNVYDNPEMLGG